MTTYTIFPVGENGHITGPARELNAERENEALREATGLLRGGAVEMWRGSQYLITLTCNPATSRTDAVIVVERREGWASCDAHP